METKAIIASAIIGLLALVLSFLAYRHSRNQLMFELMEKRILIYENLVRFCFIIIKSPTINKSYRKEFDNAAEGSFRGLALHQARCSGDCSTVLEKYKNRFSNLVKRLHSVVLTFS